MVDPLAPEGDGHAIAVDEGVIAAVVLGGLVLAVELFALLSTDAAEGPVC